MRKWRDWPGIGSFGSWARPLEHDTRSMDISLFALDPELGARVADAAGVNLSRHEERGFEDGEHKIRPLESVRGRDVYVLSSLYGDAERSVNDRLVRLLFFLGCLADASAARVTAVVPYLCYSRKDRRTKPRDPLSTRYVAGLFESVGLDRIVTLDVHNPAAYQNAFRIQAEHLEFRKEFARHFVQVVGDRDVTVVSPDAGGVKRAEAFREVVETRLGRSVGRGFMEKYRSAGVISGDRLVGEVDGSDVILIDDLISSGGTLARAAAACREAGAGRVFAAATHGLFSSESDRVLNESALDWILVSDSVAGCGERLNGARSKLEVLPAGGLIGEAIRRMNADESLVALHEP